MEKQTKPKTKRTETLTWEHCLFVGLEWEKCDINGNGIYNAYFLAHGETFHKFRVWGYSVQRNYLETLRPLTPCTLMFRWYRNWKWLHLIEEEGANND